MPGRARGSIPVGDCRSVGQTVRRNDSAPIGAGVAPHAARFNPRRGLPILAGSDRRRGSAPYRGLASGPRTRHNEGRRPAGLDSSIPVGDCRSAGETVQMNRSTPTGLASPCTLRPSTPTGLATSAPGIPQSPTGIADPGWSCPSTPTGLALHCALRPSTPTGLPILAADDVQSPTGIADPGQS